MSREVYCEQIDAICPTATGYVNAGEISDVAALLTCNIGYGLAKALLGDSLVPPTNPCPLSGGAPEATGGIQ